MRGGGGGGAEALLDADLEIVGAITENEAILLVARDSLLEPSDGMDAGLAGARGCLPPFWTLATLLLTSRSLLVPLFICTVMEFCILTGVSPGINIFLVSCAL